MQYTHACYERNAVHTRKKSLWMCIFTDLTANMVLLSLLLSISTNLIPVLSPAKLPTVSAVRNVSWIDMETSDPLHLLQYSVRLTAGGHLTTTESPFSDNYEALLQGTGVWNSFSELSRILYSDDSYIIPGIKGTNLTTGIFSAHMVPQGLCIAGDYILISAYNSAEKQENSVIYLLDRRTHEYRTTLVLDLKSHVGALAYSADQETVYIADSNVYDTRIPAADRLCGTAASTSRYRVWKLSLAEINSCISEDSDAVFVSMDQYFTTTVCPSFLCSYRDILFIGDFNANPSDQYLSYMRGYSTQTEEPVIGRINLDRSTQGVSIVDYNGSTYLISSNSFGRNAVSELKVRKLYKSEHFGWRTSAFLKRRIILPNMSEDIDISGDHVLINFESAAQKYQSNNTTHVQMDRILNVSLSGLIDGSPLTLPLQKEVNAGRKTDAHSGFRMENQMLSAKTADKNKFPLADRLAAIPMDGFQLSDDSDDRSKSRGKS